MSVASCHEDVALDVGIELVARGSFRSRKNLGQLRRDEIGVTIRELPDKNRGGS